MPFFKNIQITILLAFALFLGGCTSHEMKQYEGKVVDEQGKPIQNVDVKLCYIGWDWDWSMQGGFPLIMGQSFCSEPVTTDQFGRYTVMFAGPPSTTLLARHHGWIQLKSYLANNNRVVMIRREAEIKRRTEQEVKQEKAYRQRRMGESNTEYYCRVIRGRASNIEISYHGRQVNIIQTLMSNGHLLFAAKGTYADIKSIAKETRISIDNAGKQLLSNDFTVLPASILCDKDIYFVEAKSSAYTMDLNSIKKVNVILSELQIGFSMDVWGMTETRH